MAFRVSEYQLAAPDWVDTVRVDISATLPPDAPRSHVPEMLQELMRRRFGARTHVEQRPLPAYELLIGPNGIAMREVPSLDELGADLPANAFSAPPVSETVDGPVRSFAIPLGMTRVTATTRYTFIFTAQRTTILDAKRMTMNELATALQSTLDAPVVNRTGLSGGYEFKIELERRRTPIDVIVIDRLERTPTEN